jgi:multidrug efflux pump subunit AcrA (membrane-fusion protein)
MSKHLFLLTVTALLVVNSVQAEVYRWVDRQGKVHFSDRPETGGARKLEIREPHSGSAGTDQERLEAERLLQQQRQLDAYREAREARQQEQLEAEKAQRQQSKNCAYARNQLSEYESSRLYEPLEDGGRRYLSSTERQREIDRMQAEVSRWCDS